jgi:hypothetical protein
MRENIGSTVSGVVKRPEKSKRQRLSDAVWLLSVEGVAIMPTL